MPSLPPLLAHLSRRHFLTASAAAAALAPFHLSAQDAQTATDQGAPFSFDLLTEQMRATAQAPYTEPEQVTGFLADLDYDAYRLLNFTPERRRWENEPGDLSLAAFAPGYLFKEPVTLFEVRDGTAIPMTFSTSDFTLYNEMQDRFPADTDLPGVAGFRLHHPLNTPGVMDELVAFLGASYFRALGQGSAYGLSARGLALNTAGAEPEEFPRFSRFYLDRDIDEGLIAIYAALDSPSVAGAYRFILTPGPATVMDVTARLFFRNDVAELGVAPLTSMYLYSDTNRVLFDDFRPRVHDSDGLKIVQQDQDEIWRPLNNPSRLSGSYFQQTAPRRFGLHQRERAFESYQDTEARYHDRPSLDIEPVGDWGAGHVRLVEIPADREVYDNIVAFWVPDAAPRAGEAREYAYRMHWGHLSPTPQDTFAHVSATRTGHGGVAGVDINAGLRKFVVDFSGGDLGRMTADKTITATDITAVVNATDGKITHQHVQYIEQMGVWRLFLDVQAAPDVIVELSAHLAGQGRKLTENWVYQWLTPA